MYFSMKRLIEKRKFEHPFEQKFAKASSAKHCIEQKL